MGEKYLVESNVLDCTTSSAADLRHFKGTSSEGDFKHLVGRVKFSIPVQARDNGIALLH
jgi:hypothetical protein